MNDYEKINALVSDYNSVVKVVDSDAHQSTTRAYGGVIRAVKGKLQEYLTEELIKQAWESIGGAPSRLEINKKKIKIPIKREFIEEITDKEIKSFISENINKYTYGLSVDKHVFIDSKFVMAIECKAYTENAMIKRILVDFYLLRTKYPNLKCYLFQLESQLGGDYSKLNPKTFGSYPTKTLESYFPEVKLNIITFLKGERKIKEPIHISNFYKPLEYNSLKNTLEILKTNLKEYL